MEENNEFERTLWAAADKLRSNMDAAEYNIYDCYRLAA